MILRVYNYNDFLHIKDELQLSQSNIYKNHYQIFHKKKIYDYNNKTTK